jgi:hypothetical protein
MMKLGLAGKLVIGAMGVTACAMAQGVTGSTTFTEQFSFPPVGLALTETAQINVVNIAAAPASGTAASCTGSISFVNSTGAAIGTATTFIVATGQISSVSLPFAKAALSGNRAEIRGVVVLTGTRPATALCSLVFSLDTYDTSMGDTSTGVTHVFLGNQAALGGRN